MLECELRGVVSDDDQDDLVGEVVHGHRDGDVPEVGEAAVVVCDGSKRERLTGYRAWRLP